MARSILQKYLDNQFINLDNDENLGKLNQAIDELKQTLAKDKRKIVSACLAALDPDIPEHDPIVEEVQEVIIGKWSTFLNNVGKSKDRPVTYIRAVLLETLKSLAETNVECAALIWYTGNDIVRFYQLDRERPILQEFLSSIGSSVEREAHRIWGMATSAEITPISEPNLEVGSVHPATLVSREALENTLKAASSHSGWGRGGENPHTPNQGNYNWHEFFATRAATGLAEELNKISETQRTLAEAQKAVLSAYFEQIAPYFRQIGDSLKQSLESLRQRSNLLFWKEALYSLSLKKSYREMEGGLAAVCMAADLSGQLPKIYPRSIDFFLREALFEVLGKEACKTIKIEALVEQMAESTAELDSLLAFDPEMPGRKPFLVFLKNAIAKKCPKDALRAETGIEPGSLVTLSDLGGWVLHDLQALRLSATKE